MATIYNVKNYGAKGDGVADDTNAIQAAVNAAHAAGGGEVYIPTGTYIVHGQSSSSKGAIMLYDNITVFGDGMGSTTVKLINGWSHPVTGIFRDQSGVQNHDIGMHDLTIDGNRANTTGKTDGWFNGVTPGGPGTDTNITLDHVEIKNCSGYGFDPHEETTNLSITNCVSHGNGLDGFTMDFQIDGHVDNNVAYDNGRHGFNVVTDSQNTELSNDISYGNGSNGLMIQRGSDNIPLTHNITVTGGQFYSNGEDGIQVDLANNVLINGVNIHDNMDRGVRFRGSSGSELENSTLTNDSRAGNHAYEEIRLESVKDSVSGTTFHTTNTLIIDNIISDSGPIVASYGIHEAQDGTDYTSAIHNQITGTYHKNPSLNGPHSFYELPGSNTEVFPAA